MISQSQLDNFATSLVKAGIVQESDVEIYRNLMEQSLNDSLGEGLLVQVDPTLIKDNQQVFGREYDPVAIFKMYLQSARKNKQRIDEEHEILVSKS
jgi:hypothetical protein